MVVVVAMVVAVVYVVCSGNSSSSNVANCLVLYVCVKGSAMEHSYCVLKHSSR